MGVSTEICGCWDFSQDDGGSIKVRISLVNLLNLEIDSRKFGALPLGNKPIVCVLDSSTNKTGIEDGPCNYSQNRESLDLFGHGWTPQSWASATNTTGSFAILWVAGTVPYTRLIPIFAGDNCQMCPCYIMLSRLNQACFLKNNPFCGAVFPHAVVPFGSGAWNSHLRIHGPWARQWGSTQQFPQNQTFAHADRHNLPCLPHVWQFPHPNPQGFPPCFHHFYHWFHDVAISSRCTLYWIKSEILCYMFFHHITSLQKDLNLSPPQTIRNCKGLRMVVLRYSCSTVPSYCIITEGSNLPPPPNSTYKGLLMVIFYLIQNTSGVKGPPSARKARIRETRILRPRTLPRLSRGLLKTRGALPEKM